VSEVRDYIRYLNCAEELRTIAADKANPEIQAALLQAAGSYERLADAVELLVRLERLKLDTAAS